MDWGKDGLGGERIGDMSTVDDGRGTGLGLTNLASLRGLPIWKEIQGSPASSVASHHICENLLHVTCIYIRINFPH